MPESVGRSNARLAAVGCCLLVVIAGCSGGFTGGDAGTGTTVTPARVPEDGTGAGTRLAPGLYGGEDGNGVTDPLALASAHDRVVRNTSVTATYTERRQFANGSLHSRTAWHARASANRTFVFSRFENGGPRAAYFPQGGSIELWTDGGRFLQRINRSGEVDLGVVPRREDDTGIALPHLPGGGTVFELFESVDTRVVDRRVESGRTLYQLVGNTTRGRSRFFVAPRATAVSDVSLVAWVDERGVLRSFELTYTAVRDGTRVSVRITGRYSRLGATTVERPPWYDDAVAAGEEGPDGDR